MAARRRTPPLPRDAEEELPVPRCGHPFCVAAGLQPTERSALHRADTRALASLRSATASVDARCWRISGPDSPQGSTLLPVTESGNQVSDPNQYGLGAAKSSDKVCCDLPDGESPSGNPRARPKANNVLGKVRHLVRRRSAR
jgi:hypothetical protein